MTRDAAQRLGELELQDGAGEVPAEAERGWRSKTSNERTFLRKGSENLRRNFSRKNVAALRNSTTADGDCFDFK